MTKETITYTDLNGVQRTEDFYFDLSKPEIVKMQASAKGGYDVQLKSIAASPNGALIMEFFENFIKTAYGEKSDDGRRFMKSEEISRGFMETPAYEVLFEKLVTDAGAASEFVNRVMRANGNKSRLCSWSIPWSLFQNGKVNGTRHFSENKKKPMRKFLIMYDA